MARGWESKSVEAQIDAAEQRSANAHAAKITAEQLVRERERDGLILSRTRVLHDLETARNPRYRATLEAALHHLDEKLASLDG